MGDKFIRYSFEKVFDITSIITLFYMELPKNFCYDGESHDFWEMVYIDKGEMICTAEKNRFILKSGELIFHKPNEFHNLSGDNSVAPNVGILTFECKTRAMEQFEGKIFRLSAEERSILSELISEGQSTYRLVDPTNPLLQKMEVQRGLFGSSQMVKNLLELFLIKLSRNSDSLPKDLRRSYVIDGVDVPYPVKEIVDFIHANIYGRISIRDIAQAVGKGESTVKKLFSLYRDKGIMQYYNSLKIKESKKLIREGNYNMTQISDMLHFETPQYFSKCFKSYTKMTPSEYKVSIIK